MHRSHRDSGRRQSSARPRFGGAVARVLLAAAACALGYGALATGSASATPPLTATAQFNYTGAEQTFAVPAGVTSIAVDAVGGEGATGGQPGGFGASVTADLPVTPGQTLYVEVGGNGSTGGFNGGATGGGGCCGSGSNGGVGGGATDVRTVSSSAPGSLASRLLVAGGGGGGGGYGGGAGGAAGANGGNGGASGIDGGDAGTLTQGGAGGAGNYGGAGGTAGTVGSGGAGGTAGGSAGGGGGGGGYYGGGGGGGGGGNPLSVAGSGTGAGGGGGSSYVASGASATFATDSTGTPRVTITYDIPTSDASTSALTFTGTQPEGTISAPQSVTLTNNGSGPLVVSGVSFTGANPGDFFVGSNTCLGWVAPGSNCTLTVQFAPQAQGARAATLTISSNAAAPRTVGLDGTGGGLPQGPAGTPGATGASGAQGPVGATGAAGAMGLTTVYQCSSAARGHGPLACYVPLKRLHKAGLRNQNVHVTLERDGHVVKRFATRLHGDHLLLSLHHGLARGLYTLRVRFHSTTTTEQVMVDYTARRGRTRRARSPIVAAAPARRGRSPSSSGSRMYQGDSGLLGFAQIQVSPLARSSSPGYSASRVSSAVTIRSVAARVNRKLVGTNTMPA